MFAKLMGFIVAGTVVVGVFCQQEDLPENTMNQKEYCEIRPETKLPNNMLRRLKALSVKKQENDKNKIVTVYTTLSPAKSKKILANIIFLSK